MAIGLSYKCKGSFIETSQGIKAAHMTFHDDFNIQANELMSELNEATSALMGLVGKHHPTGSIWTAAASRQSRSYCKWSAFIRQSSIYGASLNG